MRTRALGLCLTSVVALYANAHGAAHETNKNGDYSFGEVKVIPKTGAAQEPQTGELVFYQTINVYPPNGHEQKATFRVTEKKVEVGPPDRIFTIEKEGSTLVYRTMDSFLCAYFLEDDMNAMITVWNGGSAQHVVAFDCASQEPARLWESGGKGFPEIRWDKQKNTYSICLYRRYEREILQVQRDGHLAHRHTEAGGSDCDDRKWPVVPANEPGK